MRPGVGVQAQGGPGAVGGGGVAWYEGLARTGGLPGGGWSRAGSGGLGSWVALGGDDFRVGTWGWIQRKGLELGT